MSANGYLLRLVTRGTIAPQAGQLTPRSVSWPSQPTPLRDPFDVEEVAEVGPVNRFPTAARPSGVAQSPLASPEPAALAPAAEPLRRHHVRTGRAVSSIDGEPLTAPRPGAPPAERPTLSAAVPPIPESRAPDTEQRPPAVADDEPWRQPLSAAPPPVPPLVETDQPPRRSGARDDDMAARIVSAAEPRLHGEGEATPEPRSVERAPVPAAREERVAAELRPPVPSPPAMPVATSEPPRLTIGRLLVEVVPVPAAQPAQARAPRRRGGRAARRSEPVRSNARFGLGQM